MAARGARAAGRADAAHRRAHALARRTIRKRRPASRRSCRGLQRIGLDRGPQRADRLPLGRRRCRRDCAELRGRTGRARAGRHPGHRQRALRRRCCKATRTDPDRVRGRRRSGRRRLRRQPGAAGRQRHRLQLSSNTASSAKWLELLKEIAPERDARRRSSSIPTIAAGIGQFGAIAGRGAVARAWSSARSTCATPARSSAPSRPSRARRTAA